MLQALSDPAELRRFIRDLLALSALPAIMKGYNPRQIADTVVEAVESMLDADFMYMSLPSQRDDAVVEIARTHERRAGDSMDAICTAVRRLLPEYSSRPTAAISNPFGEGTVRIAVAPIGIGGDTVIVVGSRRPDFPTAAERLLIGIAANEATIAMQRWRAEAEERIRQTEQELRLVIDTIPALVWSARPDGSIDFGNQRLLEYTGLSLDDIKDWDRAAQSRPADAILTEDGRAALAAGEPFNREVRLRRADGKYRWFLLRAVPLRDASGRIVKWYGTTSDIEDRKRTEEALRRSEGYLAEAQRLSRTGSFGWNVPTGEIFWSEESFRIFGYDRAIKPTLHLVFQRVHPDDLVLVKEVVERASENAEDWNLEHRLLMPDGSVRYLHVVARASRDDSGNLEFTGAVMEVTATKRSEEELQTVRADLAHVTRMTTLGELAASIAHEVNQPVAAMKINANAGLRWLATQPPDLIETRLALSAVVEEATRAREVIDRIRALARKAPPRKDRLDVNDIIYEVIALTRTEVQRNRVALQTGLLGDLPLISGDRVQLQQVVLNLIINAIEALNEVNEGPRELLVRTGKNGSNDVIVAVSDSGPGLAPEQFDHVFDAFHTSKPHGLGMGLAISRSIIDAHGGRLWATSNVPRGAVFQFSLPVDRAEFDRRQQSSEIAAPRSIDKTSDSSRELP